MFTLLCLLYYAICYTLFTKTNVNHHEQGFRTFECKFVLKNSNFRSWDEISDIAMDKNDYCRTSNQEVNFNAHLFCIKLTFSFN